MKANAPSEVASKVKASFNLLQSDVDTLKEIAQRRGITVTEVLRGAIATEKYLRDAADQGDSIFIEEKGGLVRQIVFR